MWREPAFAGGMLVFVAVGTIASAAGAQTASPKPSSEDVAQAAALFKEAKSLAQAEKLGPACDKFAESQRLDPHLGTLIYLATCHELLGKTASAWAEFNRAADLAARTNEASREQLARSHAAALEARLSKIVVQARVRTPDMRIEINGHQRDPGMLADPLPVDPGEYTIRASAPGYSDWVRTISVPSGPTTVEVDVPPLTALPTAARVPVPEAPASPARIEPAASQPAQDGPAAEPKSGSAWRTVGFVVGAVGLAGIGAGTYFGLTAFAYKHRADTECKGLACSPQGLADHKSENTDATLSTISFGVGLAALAAGTFMILSSPKSTPSTAQRSWIAPQVGYGSVGVAGGTVW